MRGTRTCTRSARAVPRGGVGVPRDAGRVAAGRDEDEGPDDDGREPVGVDERGDDAREAEAGAAAGTVGAVLPAGVRGVARRGGALGDAGRRGADMASILPRPRSGGPDPASHGRAGVSCQVR